MFGFLFRGLIKREIKRAEKMKKEKESLNKMVDNIREKTGVYYAFEIGKETNSVCYSGGCRHQLLKTLDGSMLLDTINDLVDSAHERGVIAWEKKVREEWAEFNRKQKRNADEKLRRIKKRIAKKK